MMDVNAIENSPDGEKVASTRTLPAVSTENPVNAAACGEPLSSDSYHRNALSLTTKHTEPSTAPVSVSKQDIFSSIIPSAGNTVMPSAEIDFASTNSAVMVPHSRTAEDLPLILCSLSIDSLHCIASFLATVDWSNFGQASHATNQVCNQVFRRVRLHGFRCATEVISAWVCSIIHENRIAFYCLTIILTFQSLFRHPNRNLGNSLMHENFQLYTRRLEFPSTLTR
jgi:hypothetical protein